MAKGEATLLLKIKTAGQDALQSVEDSFGTLKTAALGAFALISGVVVKAVADYREQEIATNALTQAMVNNGIYSKALKDDYLAQAAAIQKITLFGDEQVIAAQAAIQSQIGEQKVTKELTLAIADLAQAKGMDLVSAAQLVGKTVGSTNNVLARQGIEFDNNTRGAERLAAVTDALNGKFGGQAAAATSGLGALKQLSNTVSDLLETFGEKLTPFINLAANALKGFAEDTSSITPIMDVFVDSLKFVTKIGLEAFNGIRQLGVIIGVGLATAIESFSAAASGEFSRAIDIVKMGNQTISDELIKGKKQTSDAIAALDAIDESTRLASLEKEKTDLATSLENKRLMKVKFSEEESARILSDNQLKLDTQAAQNELERAQASGNDALVLSAQIAKQDAILKSKESHSAKMAAQQEKFRLTEKQKDEAADKAKMAAMGETLSLVAGMSKSSNSTLATIGKASALSQIAIATPVAVANAYKWGSVAGGPPLGVAMGGLAAAAMAAQAAQVVGIPLAEGGIVKATPGGIQATIGEGGRDEAVIPLENGQIPGSNSGGVTINVYGGMLGDERTAQEFAGAVDRELLKLRQNGGSVAFDRIN